MMCLILHGGLVSWLSMSLVITLASPSATEGAFFAVANLISNLNARVSARYIGMARLDKSWMEFVNNRGDPRYEKGVDNFLDYAFHADRINFRHGYHSELIQCPCRNYRNGVKLSRTDVEIYLKVDGIWMNYTNWVCHGETPLDNMINYEADIPSVEISSIAVGPSSTPTWGRGHGRRGPTRGLTDRRLEAGQQWDVQVIGGTGIGAAGVSFVSRMGVISKLHCKIWQKDLVNLPAETIAAIFRDLQLTHRWTRTPITDKEMLMHMSSMHRSWRGVLKKRHYKGKSLEDAITSVPVAVDPSDWRTMCEKWNTSDEQRIADRNKANRSHQSMPYRRGRISYYQLKEDFRRAHDRDPDRLELFRMGRCKQLPDGTGHWVDEESRSRYERKIQLTTPSLDSESGNTPISPEDVFISVMGKDRSGRVRCGGSRETLRTWYGVGEGSSSTMQTMADRLRQQGEEMDHLRAQVDSMRLQQSRVEDLERQVAEMEDLRRQMDEMRQHQRVMDTFMTQFQTSQGGVQQPPRAGSEGDGDDDTDEDGDDFDD